MRGCRPAALAALITVTACQTSSPGDSSNRDIQWPAASAGAPAHVFWTGALHSFERGRMTRFARLLAGAESHEGLLALQRPVAVAVSDRRVFMVDTSLNAVIVSDHKGRKSRVLDLPPPFRPVAAALSHDHRWAYVADGDSGTVRVFDEEGNATDQEVLVVGMTRCGGLSVCRNGDLVLTDVANGSVLRVSQKGKVVARAGGRGHNSGRFNFPTAVAEHPDGTLWVLDSLNFRVRHLDAELNDIGSFGELGDGTGHMALPKGLAIDPDGHIYISDAQFDVIQVFDTSGRLLFVIGGRGHGPGELWSPAGLACSSSGAMAVADSGNRRVHLMRYRRSSGDAV